MYWTDHSPHHGYTNLIGVLGLDGTPPNLSTISLKQGVKTMYSAASANGAAISHPSIACTMLSITSFEAWPVITFLNASEVKGKCPLPVITSPKRKKGTIKLNKT